MSAGQQSLMLKTGHVEDYHFSHIHIIITSSRAHERMVFLQPKQIQINS
jgi:hypothetical protein